MSSGGSEYTSASLSPSKSAEPEPEVGREIGEAETEVVVVVDVAGFGADEDARSPSGTWSAEVSICRGRDAIVAGIEELLSRI